MMSLAKFHSRLGLKFAAVYIALVIFAFLYLYLTIDDPFAAFFIMPLTFPWSYLQTIIWVIAGVNYLIPDELKIITFIYYAFVNIFLVYLLGSKTEKSYKKIIILDFTHMFNKPNGAEIIDLYSGDSCIVIGSTHRAGNKYYYVRLKDGRKGYIRADNRISMERNKREIL
jgi:hypothetical protein